MLLLIQKKNANKVLQSRIFIPRSYVVRYINYFSIAKANCRLNPVPLKFRVDWWSILMTEFYRSNQALTMSFQAHARITYYYTYIHTSVQWFSYARDNCGAWFINIIIRNRYFKFIWDETKERKNIQVHQELKTDTSISL